MFERSKEGRMKGVKGKVFPLDDPALPELIDADLWAQVQEEIELLDEVRFSRKAERHLSFF